MKLLPRASWHHQSSLAYLEEVVQAAQVAASAEVGLVEVLEEQDEGAMPRVLAGAQLLGDGEELALHLGAVEQQHRPEDKETAVRLGRQAWTLVAQEILGQIHTRWQWPLMLRVFQTQPAVPNGWASPSLPLSTTSPAMSAISPAQ